MALSFRTLAAAGAMALALTACGINQKQCDGESLSRVVMETTEMVPASVTKSWGGKEAKSVIAVFNAEEPPTDFQGDTVTVMINPGHPIARLIFSRGDCVTHRVDGPVQAIAQLFADAGV